MKLLGEPMKFVQVLEGDPGQSHSQAWSTEWRPGGTPAFIRSVGRTGVCVSTARCLIFGLIKREEIILLCVIFVSFNSRIFTSFSL